MVELKLAIFLYRRLQTMMSNGARQRPLRNSKGTSPSSKLTTQEPAREIDITRETDVLVVGSGPGGFLGC